MRAAALVVVVPRAIQNLLRVVIRGWRVIIFGRDGGAFGDKLICVRHRPRGPGIGFPTRRRRGRIHLKAQRMRPLTARRVPAPPTSRPTPRRRRLRRDIIPRSMFRELRRHHPSVSISPRRLLPLAVVAAPTPSPPVRIFAIPFILTSRLQPPSKLSIFSASIDRFLGVRVQSSRMRRRFVAARSELFPVPLSSALAFYPAPRARLSRVVLGVE